MGDFLGETDDATAALILELQIEDTQLLQEECEGKGKAP
jgi:hypothetical protein